MAGRGTPIPNRNSGGNEGNKNRGGSKKGEPRSASRENKLLAAAMIASGAAISEVARVVAVADRTIWNWQQDPEFVGMVADATEALRERVVEAGITPARVLQELGRIAFANPRDVMDWGPNGVTLKPSEDLSAEVVPAVAEVSETQSASAHTVKVKMHDKVGALTQLGRSLGLFSDKMELKHDLSGLSDEELEILERARSKITPKP